MTFSRDDLRRRSARPATTIVFAAARYFSSSSGESVSTSPMLSNPCPVSSGGNSAVGVVVDADQVADRVAVFDPVEPADGDAAGVGVRRVDPEGPVLDPVLQEPPLLGGRLRLVGRGHDAGPDVLQDAQPEVAVVQPGLVGLQAVEVHPALLDPVAVTAEAVLLQDRLDLLAEPLRGRVGRGRDLGDRHQGREEDGDQRPRGEPSGGDSRPVGWSRAIDPRAGEIRHGVDPISRGDVSSISRLSRCLHR